MSASASSNSLQSISLFKLIEQFEHYSPELLAQLPPRQRRMLLVHLPIADICQVAGTCVFDGIDAESIWEELYEKNIPRYFASLDGFPANEDVINAMKFLEENEETFQERYLAILVHIILNRARPSGCFAATRNYGDYIFDNAPPSIIAQAPVDIVNTIIAGERLDINQYSDNEAQTPPKEDHSGADEDVNGAKEEDHNGADKDVNGAKEDDHDGADEDVNGAKEEDHDGADEDDSGADYDEEEEEIDLETEYENGDVEITAVTEYDNENQDWFLENRCDHERGEHFLEDSVYEETNHRCQYIPPRFSRYALKENKCRLSDEDAITFLVEKCKYQPKHLLVSVTTYSSKSWEQGLLSRFLSKVMSLKLSFNYLVAGTEGLKQILTAILSNPSPQLSSLVLDSVTDLDFPDFLEYDERKQDTLVNDDHLSILEELCEYPPSQSSSLCTLQELTVHGRFSGNGLASLASVISNQQELASLSLTSFMAQNEVHEKYDDGQYHDYRMKTPCTFSQPFMKALVSFFKNPCFENVTIQNVTYPLNILQDLIAGYLTSPSSHAQTLTLKAVAVDINSNTSSKECTQLEVSDLACQYKSLEISVSEMESSQEFFLPLLSLQPFVLRSLKLSCHDHLYERNCALKYPVHDDFSFLPIIAKNASFRVNKLSVCQPTNISSEAIQAILKNDELKLLELLFCGGLVDFRDITENVLVHLQKNASLEELKIEEGVCKNKYDFSFDHSFDKEAVALFFDTLFSLPGLDRFALELSFAIGYHTRRGRNYSEFVEIAHESWKKKSGGQKLKRFVLRTLFGRVMSEMANEMGLQVISSFPSSSPEPIVTLGTGFLPIVLA